MLKRKPKTLTPAQVEEIRAKDFFDMILPGTIKFFSDHYIVGDSYRCVWAIREYPPSTEEQAILSRLNAFLDSELEQLLCFDTEIDAEKFCREKSAIFIIMPEENPNTFFMISLIIQQLYREILAVADENGGQLKNRCVFFCDEFGTLPKIESAEMMFSASRSRRLQIVPIIQSFAQLEKSSLLYALKQG